MQVKLLQSEQQLMQLKQTISQHNGPTEFVDSASSKGELLLYSTHTYVHEDVAAIAPLVWYTQDILYLHTHIHTHRHIHTYIHT